MFMRQISEQAGIRPRKIGDDAMAVLQTHDWPGNIRQLRNNIERLMILARPEGGEAPISADMLLKRILATCCRRFRRRAISTS